MRQYPPLPLQPTAALPKLLPWHTWRGAFANLLACVLAVAGGEWLAHQAVYLIEYRSQFATIMASTPHHIYMARIGAVLAATVLLVATLWTVAMYRQSALRRHLLGVLPARTRRRARTASCGPTPGRVAVTALLLLTGQLSIYLIQENLESVALGWGYIGVAVLLPALHPAALPVHLAIAFSASAVLWALSAKISASRRSLRVIELLAELFGHQSDKPPRCISRPFRIQRDGRPSSPVGLRSPPQV